MGSLDILPIIARRAWDNTARGCRAAATPGDEDETQHKPQRVFGKRIPHSFPSPLTLARTILMDNALRSHVRRHAGDVCEYCRLPQKIYRLEYRDPVALLDVRIFSKLRGIYVN